MKAKKNYDDIPYKLYEITTIPIVTDDGKKQMYASKKFKITGKSTYYHSTGDMDAPTVVFMITGENGDVVFELPADYLFTCRVIGIEETTAAVLKAVPDGPK